MMNGKAPLTQSRITFTVLAAVGPKVHNAYRLGGKLTYENMRYLDLLIVQSKVNDEIVVVKDRQGRNGQVTLAEALRLVARAQEGARQREASV